MTFVMVPSAASKLGAANRHEAVHIARTHGWI
jgi:two-component system, NarL family, response regulator DesR